MTPTRRSRSAREPVRGRRGRRRRFASPAASGLAGLSMRALADELGVTTMAAYYHVSSKDGLTRPGGQRGSRQRADTRGRRLGAARLAEQNRRMRRTLLDHPGLSTYLQERPLTAAGRADDRPHARDARDGGLQQGRGAGSPPPRRRRSCSAGCRSRRPRVAPARAPTRPSSTACR